MLPIEYSEKEISELDERLRNLVALDERLTEELQSYCLHHPEPAVQVAAIIGLERLGSKRAVLILTERVLQGGRLHPTKRAMEGLAELAPNGGLLALTATFLDDSRLVHQKLTLLFHGAQTLHREDVAESIEAIYQQKGTKYDLREVVPEILTMLERIPLADISHRAVLATSLGPVPVWAGNVQVPDDAKMEHAVAYSKLRLPDFTEMLRAQRNSNTGIYSESIS